MSGKLGAPGAGGSHWSSRVIGPHGREANTQRVRQAFAMQAHQQGHFKSGEAVSYPYSSGAVYKFFSQLIFGESKPKQPAAQAQSTKMAERAEFKSEEDIEQDFLVDEKMIRAMIVEESSDSQETADQVDKLVNDALELGKGSYIATRSFLRARKQAKYFMIRGKPEETRDELSIQNREELQTHCENYIDILEVEKMKFDDKDKDDKIKKDNIERVVVFLGTVMEVNKSYDGKNEILTMEEMYALKKLVDVHVKEIKETEGGSYKPDQIKRLKKAEKELSEVFGKSAKERGVARAGEMLHTIAPAFWITYISATKFSEYELTHEPPDFCNF